MKKFAYAAAAIGLTIAAPVAAAQSDLIQQLFDKATEIYGSKGFNPTGWETRGELGNGASKTVQVSFSGGSQFSIVGVCDGDCKDLNIYLTDSAGKLVDSDVEDDDFPIVAASAPGTYTARIEMKSCTAGPCGFGAKAFKQ
jgi:opacity protein-like surface antigen